MDPTDVIRYAVYVVIVEDTNDAFEDLANVADSFEEAGTYNTWDEAEDVLTSISREPRIAARAAQESRNA